jgi:hypothetical protein
MSDFLEEISEGSKLRVFAQVNRSPADVPDACDTLREFACSLNSTHGPFSGKARNVGLMPRSPSATGAVPKVAPPMSIRRSSSVESDAPGVG